MDSVDAWFVSATPATAISATSAASAAEVRLFCFPFAGGTAQSFLPWQTPLGPRIDLHVAALPGRGHRLLEDPLDGMDALVARLADAVIDLADRPFAFFGHSLGALIAFEVARALRRRGASGPGSLWVSGAEGPQTRLLDRRLHDLPEHALIEGLRDYRGTPEELLDNLEMMRLLLPGLRADFALSEDYAYRPEPRLELPIHVLRGDRDPHVDGVRAAGWTHETSGPIETHLFAGDHFFIHPHQTGLAALLARTLCVDPVAALPTGRGEPR